MYFFGFSSAIALFSVFNTVMMYKNKKKEIEDKKSMKAEEEEFQKILEKAFGITPEKEDKPGTVLNIVKDDDDDTPIQ